MGKRPIADARIYDWKDGDAVIPGIALFAYRRPAAHATEAEARELADHLHDLADQLAARHQNAPQLLNDSREPKPCYTSHSATLTAADGIAEPPLPTTAPE